jgi:serine/threonine-protein kinase HipA
MKFAPVHYWLPNQTNPTLAGYFEWQKGQGRFTYLLDYLSNENAVAIAPSIPLRLKRIVSAQQYSDGIFGVFADASADAWGKRILESIYGELDAFDALVKSKDDGVGAVIVGYPADKVAALYSLGELIDAANNLQLLKSNDVPVDLIHALAPTTSVGGMKPKISVEHDGSMWLAKFTERGDSVYLPHAESAMLKLGAECGINTCESRVIEIAKNQYAILVKRFDRHWVLSEKTGYARKGFASAHTVLGLTPLSGLKEKSYIRLSDELKKWVAPASLVNERRELWRRIVFNALIGNADDHSKNHGLLQTGDTWKFSPAFDLTPFQHRRASLALSMSFAVTEGRATSVVSPASLISCSQKFGYPPDEAKSVLVSMAAHVRNNWMSLMLNEGMPAIIAESFSRSFSLAEELKNGASITSLRQELPSHLG